MFDANIDKFHRVESSSTATTGATNQTQTTGSVPSGPIIDGKGQKDNFTEVVRDNNLSNADKIKLLKKMYPNVDEAVLASLLSTVSVDEKDNKASKFTPTQTEPVTLQVGTKSEPKKVQISEEEQTLNNYAETLQQQGTKIESIDDVIKLILNKPEKDLSPTEQKIKEFLQKSSSGKLNENDIKKFVQDTSDSLDKLIPKEIIETEFWQSKTPKEKLDARVDAVLSKMVPAYNENGGFPDGVKNNMREQFYDKMISAVMPQVNNLDPKEQKTQKKFAIQIMSILADATEKSNLSMKEIMEMDKKGFNELVGKYVDNVVFDKLIGNNEIDIQSKEWQNLSNREKIDKFSELIIKGLDKNIEGDELKQTKKQWINVIGKQMFKDKWSDNPKDNQRLVDSVITHLEAIKLNYDIKGEKVSLSEYQNSKKLRNELVEQREKILGIKVSDQQKLYRIVSSKLDREITQKDVYNYLIEKQKSSVKLTDAEKKELNGLKPLVDAGINETIQPIEETIAYALENQPEYKGLKIGDKIDLYLKNYCEQRNITLDKLPDEEKAKILKSVGAPGVMFVFGKKLGYEGPAAVVNSLGPEYAMIAAHMAKNGYNDWESAAKLHGGVLHNNGPEFKKYHNVAANITALEAKVNPQYTIKVGEIACSRDNPNAPEIADLLQNAFVKNNVSKENISYISTSWLNNSDISYETKHTIVDSQMKYAYDDSTRLYYQQETTSKVKDPVVLESVASSAKYVEDAQIKQQYVSNVKAEASNYDSNTQKNIDTALKTGELSKQTQAKIKADSTQKQTDSKETKTDKKSDKTNKAQKTETKTTNTKTDTKTSSAKQGEKPATATKTVEKQTAQTTVQTTNQTAGKTSATQTSQASTPKQTNQTTTTTTGEKLSTPTQTTTSSSVKETSISSSGTSHVQYTNENNNSSFDYNPTSYSYAETPINNSSAIQTSYNINNISSSNTQQTDAFRQEVMNRALELKNNIEESIEEWEARHRKLPTEDGELITAAVVIDSAVEAINSSNIGEKDKVELKKLIIKASSIDEIFEILVSKSVDIVNVKEKILDLLGSTGSESDVQKVVTDVIGDDSIIKEIYTRSSSASVKKELVNMLSDDTLFELLDAKKISNISDIRPKTIRRYIEKNIYSMRSTEFKEYLKYISRNDDIYALIELYNKAHGIYPQQSKSQTIAQEPSPSVEPEQPDTPAQPLLAQNELSKTLSDGSIITRKDSSFGAISNNEDTYKILTSNDNKQDEGSPIGMNDEVLTVGSSEWNKKYNNNNTLNTAFTMAALDDEDDFGGPNFGSTGNFKGTLPKKKPNPKRFNALG